MNFGNLTLATGRTLRTGAARIAALFPGSSIQFGPPRNAATTASINDPSRIVRHSLIWARSSTRPVAELADPPLAQSMSQPGHATIKEIFVAEVPQGRYWGRFHGYIIDRTDTLLTDLSPTFTPPGHRHDALGQLKLPPLRELPGTVAVINTLFANNYHHWLLDTVPRFDWLRRAGYDWNQIDHFIFPKKLWPHNLQTLALLGIDPAKVICSHPHLHIRADRLVVPGPSEPAHHPLEYDYTPEGLRFVRELFLTDNPFLEQKHPVRILISRERANARRLVQADRINHALFDQGFTKILLEDYSLQEQAAIFHQADCIVMPTGGNLANLVFCRPGTIVIELFSPSYSPPFTYAFMGEIGLRYYGLVAEKVSRPHPDSREGNEDIDIDPDRLAEVVRQALAKLNLSNR
jgi:capsular polysaccharide biosynthesis protein